jgi:hypothetical protein
MLSGDEVVPYVISDGLLQLHCGCLPSGGVEAAHIGAGVILVLVADVIWHVDELDLRLPT